MNGFFNIHKPTGMSSAAVVAVMRRLTGEKRIGHAGTLDPEAAGVLPVMAGKATRLFDYLADKEKEYVAVVAFGQSTDTQDATGTVIETGDRFPDREQVALAAEKLTGEIVQVPSVYSAIKLRGEPLYARARRGEQVRAPERRVLIRRIVLLREMPDHGLEIRVSCGRGTYIRTLCADLGQLCGCPAHMRSLVRTQSGPFRLETALTLEEARMLADRGELAARMLPPDYPLAHLQRVDLPRSFRKKVVNGAKLPLTGWNAPSVGEDQTVRIYLTEAFWGLASRQGDQLVWKAQIAPEETEGMDTCGS